MAWKNHEEDPMEQMRRAFLGEIKDLKNKKKYDELSEDEKKIAFHVRAIDGIGE